LELTFCSGSSVARLGLLDIDEHVPIPVKIDMLLACYQCGSFDEPNFFSFFFLHRFPYDVKIDHKEQQVKKETKSKNEHCAFFYIYEKSIFVQAKEMHVQQVSPKSNQIKCVNAQQSSNYKLPQNSQAKH
jgi:hypothetical protein